jgi:hypothetical protein
MSGLFTLFLILYAIYGKSPMWGGIINSPKHKLPKLTWVRIKRGYGRTDGWTDGRMDGGTGGWTGGQADGRGERRLDGGQADGRGTGGWTGGQLHLSRNSIL